MVGVVDLADEVGDRELDMARLGAQRLVAGHEAEPRSEEGEDVRGLRHDGAPDPHERRREGQRAPLLPVEEVQHRRRAALRPRDVDVVGAGLLEREADELAAALDHRPVVEVDAQAGLLRHRIHVATFRRSGTRDCLPLADGHNTAPCAAPSCSSPSS